MATGIRKNAEVAVRAGIRHIQFAVRPEEEAQAIDAYLSSLVPLQLGGGDSKAIARGAEVFKRARCIKCHPAPLYADGKQRNLRTGRGIDEGRKFDTPTLVEIWRTAPYLHDGRAATLHAVLTEENPGDRHGQTSLSRGLVVPALLRGEPHGAGLVLRLGVVLVGRDDERGARQRRGAGGEPPRPQEPVRRLGLQGAGRGGPARQCARRPSGMLCGTPKGRVRHFARPARWSRRSAITDG